MAKKKGRPATTRSPKAGRPPAPATSPARVRRRRRSAQAAVRKDTTLMQAPEGPRVLWAGARSTYKKG